MTTELEDAATSLGDLADQEVNPYAAPLARTLADVVRQVEREHPRVTVGDLSQMPASEIRTYCGKCRTQNEEWPTGGLIAVYASDPYPCATVAAALAVVAPLIAMLED